MSWWNANYLYRQKLTFGNSAQTTDDLVDFPVLVKLTTSNSTIANAKSAGADIRFVDSDDTTELKYEIEKWTDDTEAYIWVKVPQIDKSSDTDFIYMYYGYAAATDNQDAANAWDANYKAVYHLNKESGDVIDSKGAYTGTNHGAIRGVAGQIDNAFDFDGEDDYVSLGTGVLGLTDKITVETWGKGDIDQNGRLVSKHAAGDFGWILSRFATDDKIQWCISTTGSDWNDKRTSINSFPIDVMKYFVGWYDGSYMRVYINGNEDTEGDLPFALVGNINDSSQDGEIGLDTYGAAAFGGIIDEVRISDIARSADWIKAQYLSMTLAFVTFGNIELQQSDSGTGSDIISVFARDGLSDSGTGADTSSLAVALTGADSGVGADTSSLAVAITGTDSGEGTDALSALLVALTSSDSGTGTDALVTCLLTEPAVYSGSSLRGIGLKGIRGIGGKRGIGGVRGLRGG